MRVGYDRKRRPQHEICIRSVRIALADIRVIGARASDIDGAVRPGQALRHLSAALQRFPGELEQQPLLRIHLLDLAGRQAEEPGIEARDVAQRPRLQCIGFAGNPAGMVELAVVPARLRNLRDSVLTVQEKAPKSVGGLHAAWKSAGMADNCNSATF